MTTNRVLSCSSALRSLVLAGVIALPSVAAASEIVLRSQDGTIDITGDFVEFSENTYVIRTALGELRLPAERVRCEGEACPRFEPVAADVKLAGSDTLGVGILPLLLEGYAGYLDAEATVGTTNDADEILASFIGENGFGDELGTYKVSSSTSDDAFAALMDKRAELGMAARRILPDEARALRDAGAGNMVSPQQEHIIAVDSIVVITHPSNPVAQLTMQQLGGIYSGAITNWNEVGGPDLPIMVVGRQEDSGTSAIFYRSTLGAAEDWRFSNDIVVAKDNNEAAKLVNDNAGAVGFVGYAFQRGAKAMTLVNSCGLTMSPDAFSARTEEYALQRRLYLYNRDDTLTEKTSDFLEFALSYDADSVIRKAGFIDLGVARQPQPMDSARARSLLDPSVDDYEGNVMREMLATMVDHDRLSTTFRFRIGVSKLDERGIVDMARLAQYLETVPAGADVTFVGFTDDTGSFDANRDLSRDRAQQVMAELQSYAGDRIGGLNLASMGFGEVAPSGCNTDELGRAINRRVEVWVKNPV